MWGQTWGQSRRPTADFGDLWRTGTTTPVRECISERLSANPCGRHFGSLWIFPPSAPAPDTRARDHEISRQASLRECRDQIGELLDVPEAVASGHFHPLVAEATFRVVIAKVDAGPSGRI